MRGTAFKILNGTSRKFQNLILWAWHSQGVLIRLNTPEVPVNVF